MSQEKSLASVVPIEQRGYAHPEVLVSTEWVAGHLDDASVRLVESNEDLLLYETGHIPGAVKIDWTNDLNDQVVRDYIGPDALQKLLRSKGISRDTTIVLYGDKNNWWATYAFWVFRLFGLENLRLMDGGRQRWAEEGRPLVTDAVTYPPGDLSVPARDDGTLRAFRDEVLAHVRAGGPAGRRAEPRGVSRREAPHARVPAGRRRARRPHPGRQEHPVGPCGPSRDAHVPPRQRAPHAVRLRERLDPTQETVVYCRIGERSSHSWFVLTYLLGFAHVRNYDGSWTEWGNGVGLPIERS